MKLPPDLADELADWGMRGLLCALPSAGWAVMAGFTAPGEIAAMGLGVSGYVAGFAWLSASQAMAATEGRRDFLRTLRRVAWLKGGSSLGMAALVPLTGGVGQWLTVTLAIFAPGYWPDFFAGAAVLAGVAAWAQVIAPEGVARLDSFAWTLLTTLLQGALISVLLIASALAWLALKRLWEGAVRRRFSPASSAG